MRFFIFLTLSFIILLNLSQIGLTYTYVEPATEGLRGGVYLATDAEMASGSNDADAVTPQTMFSIRSSTAEAQTGSADNRWMSPAKTTDHFNYRKAPDSETLYGAGIGILYHFISPDSINHMWESHFDTYTNSVTPGGGESIIVASSGSTVYNGYVYFNVVQIGCNVWLKIYDLHDVDKTVYTTIANPGPGALEDTTQSITLYPGEFAVVNSGGCGDVGDYTATFYGFKARIY